MNIEGKAEFPPSQSSAIRRFGEVRAEGAKLIDLGCMQINYHYHSQAFPSVAANANAEPECGLCGALLKRLREREGNWTMAVARYHAGPNNDPAQKRYVCRVMANMVATGFGNWDASGTKLLFQPRPAFVNLTACRGVVFARMLAMHTRSCGHGWGLFLVAAF
ncbi:Soluble lytic murein transglycosylase and related regulatory proteins (some containing LysM/invasin domains) [Brucella melitensis]|nr:Soluble lytic murein transglycosylase and related regulatory proteins (some containing LysM/invasin domains) [Brucella melitensis]